MKLLIHLAMVFVAFFITLNATPVRLRPPRSGFKFGAAEEQQSDEIAKVFLNICSKIFTTVDDKIGRGGSIQVDDELEHMFLDFASNIFSAMSKKADPNDEAGHDQTLLKGFNSILSVIKKQLKDEGGVIQSDDELMQKLFGILNVEDGEAYIQSDTGSNEGLGRTILNTIRKLSSAARNRYDPNDDDSEVPLSFFDGIDSILSVVRKRLDEGHESVSDKEIMQTVFDAVVDNMLLAADRNIDPNDEMTHTFINGFKTLLPFIRNIIMGSRVTITQSSNGDLKQAFINTLGKTQADNGDDEFGRTAINVMNSIFSTLRRSVNPNNEFFNALLDFYSLIINNIFRDKSQITDEDMFIEFVSHVNNTISAFIKEVERSRKTQPSNPEDEAKIQLLGRLAQQFGYTSLSNKSLNG